MGNSAWSRIFSCKAVRASADRGGCGGSVLIASRRRRTASSAQRAECFGQSLSLDLHPRARAGESALQCPHDAGHVSAARRANDDQPDEDVDVRRAGRAGDRAVPPRHLAPGKRESDDGPLTSEERQRSFHLSAEGCALRYPGDQPKSGKKPLKGFNLPAPSRRGIQPFRVGAASVQ